MIIAGYFLIKALPMIISRMAIYLSYKLFIFGVTGQASISLDAKTINGQLVNAVPGLFFAVGGIVALIMSICKGVEIEFGGPEDSEAYGTTLKL